MNKIVARPVFYETQILSAADLLDTVSYFRSKDERHARHLHSWGIAEGLELALDSPEELFVEPGMAIDGAGREILVTEREPLELDRFQQIQGNTIDDEKFYPVFLRSLYEVASPSVQSVGLCGTAQSSRVTEGFVADFGRPGDEAGLDDQEIPSLDGDPSPAEGPGAWLILLGFVQAKQDSGLVQFTKVTESAGNIGRRYVGVKAESVAANAGALTLQTRHKSSVGDPILKLSEDEGGQLCFGLYNGPGALEKLVTISSTGDIKTEGKLSGRLTTGTVQLQSGIATDGMILPLPPGIKQEQVDDGSATIHAIVSPHINNNNTPDQSKDWGVMVQAARVDAERRLHCQICWFELDFTTTPTQGQTIVSVPGTCDYLVLGTTTPEEDGGQS